MPALFDTHRIGKCLPQIALGIALGREVDLLEELWRERHGVGQGISQLLLVAGSIAIETPPLHIFHRTPVSIIDAPHGCDTDAGRRQWRFLVNCKGD